LFLQMIPKEQMQRRFSGTYSLKEMRGYKQKAPP